MSRPAEGDLSGWRTLESVTEESQSRETGAAVPQWEGDCEDGGEWEGGFLAGGRTAQAMTADLGHGEAEDRTGLGTWFCSFLVPQ